MKYILFIIVLLCALDTCRELYLSAICKGKYSFDYSKCYSDKEMEELMKSRGYLFD